MATEVVCYTLKFANFLNFMTVFLKFNSELSLQQSKCQSLDDGFPGRLFARGLTWSMNSGSYTLKSSSLTTLVRFLVKKRAKVSSTCLSFASCFCPVSSLDIIEGPRKPSGRLLQEIAANILNFYFLSNGCKVGVTTKEMPSTILLFRT